MPLKIVVLDTEGDGLAYECTKIHVMSWSWDEGETVQSTNDYNKMREILSEADLIVCHNVVRHDKVVFKRILGVDIPYTKFADTLALSWYLYPARPRHGLEFIGTLHGIAKPEVDDWQNLSYEEYAHRCEEDVKINCAEWKSQRTRLYNIYRDEINQREDQLRLIRYLSFKMDILREQEENPLSIDVERAKEMFQTLSEEKEEKVEQLKQIMPKKPIGAYKNKPKLMYKKDGSLSSNGEKWLDLLKEHGLPDTHEAPIWVVKSYEEGNPNSTQQVKDWLFDMGWKPCTFDYVRNKDTGEERKIPQVRKDGELTDSVLKLKDEESDIEILEGLTILTHRIGIFKALIEASDDDMKCASQADGLTNTMRFKHRRPIVNLPGVEKPYGSDVRGCIVTPDADHILSGSDVCSLEDMTKRHYMKPLDPQYVEEMSEEGFDPHLDLAERAGAVTYDQIQLYNKGELPELKSIRHNYKQTNYAAVYGVGAPKLARMLGIPEVDARKLIEAYWDRNWAVKKISSNMKVKTLYDGTMWLRNPVSGFYYSLRYQKDRWSTVNQSTGVYVFDMWMMYMRKMGIIVSMNYHDEVLLIVPKNKKDLTESILHEAMLMVNKTLKLNVTIEVDVQFGNTYADVH